MLGNNLYSRYKNSLHYKTFERIITNPKLLLYILFFDTVLFIIFYYLNILITNMMPTDISKLNLAYSYTILAGILLYSFSALAIYSYFKYIILGFITNIVELKNKPIKFTFNHRFLLLNLAIFSFASLVIIFLNSILSFFINEKYLNIMGYGVLIMIIITTYLVLTISHVLFVKGLGIREIFDKILKTKIVSQSIFVLISSGIFFLIYLIILSLLVILLKKIITLNILNIITLTLTHFAYYTIMFYNRIYTYLIIEKFLNREKKKDAHKNVL